MCSSCPPGARASAWTVPVSTRDDSWVSRLVSSNASSPTAALLTTACISPVPSRTTRNAILPATRLWRSHPRTVASCPAYRAISWISEIGMRRVYIRDTGGARRGCATAADSVEYEAYGPSAPFVPASLGLSPPVGRSRLHAERIPPGPRPLSSLQNHRSRQKSDERHHGGYQWRPRHRSDHGEHRP